MKRQTLVPIMVRRRQRHATDPMLMLFQAETPNALDRDGILGLGITPCVARVMDFQGFRRGLEPRLT